MLLPEIKDYKLETEEDLKKIFDIFMEHIYMCRWLDKNREKIEKIEKGKFLKDYATNSHLAATCLERVHNSKFNDEEKKHGVIHEMEKEYDSIDIMEGNKNE